MNLHPVHHGLRRKMLAVLVAACYTSASANPTAPQVIAGQATFQQSGNLFSITNTPNAIINWQSFSIAPDEVTRFIQQSANSRVLNRITGQDPSRILGALQSNGHVYLINPNGVVFGKDARVDVQSLVASSLALSDNDFLAGRHRFSGANAGKVVNEGAIVTPGGGRVYLVGASVENSGVVTSPQGEVVLAAGHTVQLVDSSDPSVHVVVSAPSDQALNLGQVLASGGRVGIYGALVNQRGKVSADSAVRGENGKIVLKSSGTTLLEKGSVTSATHSAGKGGDIALLGRQVGLTGDAVADASGAEGGGNVLIGGGRQGKDAAVPNAQQTYIGEQAAVKADATGSGDGGTIIAWSDKATRVYGSLSARGGAQGGDGGFIETSGGYLDMQGKVDTRAPQGKTGQLLLDPTNITIISGSPTGSIGISSNIFSESGSYTNSELDTGRLQNALDSANITVSTENSSGAGAGNITVSAPISWGTGNALTLRADNNIVINDTITAASAPLMLNALGGSISQSAAVTVASLTASAPAGSIALTNSSNAISGTVTASALNSIGLTAQTLTTGAVTSSGSGAISLTSSSGALTVNGNVTTGGGAVTLQAAYGQGIATGSSTAISSGNGLITLRADNMDLQGSVSAGSGAISVAARSTSQALHLGGTEADAANTLALSEEEIKRLSTTGDITLTHNGDIGSPDVVVNALDVTSSHPSGALNIVSRGSAGINVQGTVAATGNLVLATTDTSAARITLDGMLSSGSAVVLGAGLLSVNQTITAPIIGVVTENSIDLGASSETSGVLNIPTATLSKFNTSNLSFTVDDAITAGNITISQPLTWSGHLFLSAMGQYITGSNAITVGGQLSLENGSWVQDGSLPSLSLGQLALTSAGFRRVAGGDGTSNSPYQITDVYGLQGATSFNSAEHYILANNIDASSTSAWNGGSGFAPLGSSGSPYTGTFDGNGMTISGLAINRSSTDGVGLFGYLGAGTVKNLTLSGSITGAEYTGAVAGSSSGGTVSGVTSSASVSGVFAVGGLVGMSSSGTVTGSSSSGAVTASGSGNLAKAGGLVGFNYGGLVTKSSASGAVSTTSEVAGGLVGYNSGSITKSYATGSVTGGRSVGGLAGYNVGTISDTYATGSVSGTSANSGLTHAQVGGLAGYSAGSIGTSYTTSALSASGFTDVHGAVGLNSSGSVTSVYWNSSTAGSGVTDTAATSLTSTQMLQQSNFSGFDFSGTWQLYNGSTSAMLRDFLVPLTVTLTGGTTSKTYDGTAQAFDVTAAYSGFTGGDTSSSLGGALGWGTALHAGSYTAGGLSSTKYDISYTGASSSLTISQRPVTVTVSGSKVYDGLLTFPGATIALSNVQSADSANVGTTGSVTFQTKGAGTGKGLNFSLSLTGSAASDYTLASTTGTGTITAAPLTLSNLSAVSRVYDSTNVASLNTGSATLCCAVSGDTVTFSYTPGLATFADKNIGTGKVVTIGASAFTLSGADAANYTMTPPTGLTANVTAATLTVSGVTGPTRTYDGTTTAALAGTASLGGVLGSDVVNVTLGNGAFADKNVGTGKAVTVSGSSFTLGGADAGNYTLTLPSGLTGDITAAALTVSGVTAVNRTYDATTTAALTGTPVLSGIITVGSTTDDVSASASLGSGTFADKNAGSGKAVTAPGSVITLQGADAGNYTVSALTGLTADISQAALTIYGMTASNRTYNMLTSATTSGGYLTGIQGSDVVAIGAVSADFDTKNVGTGKAVTVSNVALTGADAANYSVTPPTGLTANITPVTLTVTGMTANSRVYDATTTATTTGGALNGVLGSETVAMGTATASFADKNVGTGKAVTVSALPLTGADAGNYSVTLPTGLTADITAASLTVSGIAGVSRAYNAGTGVTISGAPVLNGVIGSDAVTLYSSLSSGTFADKNVGTGKAITIPGGALTLTGGDAGNYTLVTPSLTADVTAAAATVSGLTATSRAYDGGTSVATSGGSLYGIYEGDTVTMGTVTADFADKNVGTGKAVTVSQVALGGADAGNYTVTLPTGLTANVTPAALTVTGIAGVSRVYDGTVAATTSGGALSGVIGSDTVAIDTVTAAFADKNADTGKPVTVSAVTLSGADAGNYAVTLPSGLTADITPASLTVSGLAGVSRAYNGSTGVYVSGTPVLAGVIGSDSVTLNSSVSIGNFADKNVGTAKAITLPNGALAISGTDAANYALSQPALSADVTALALSVSGLSATSRAYNGGTSVATSGGSLSGIYEGELVTMGAVTADFADKNVGTGKAVTVSHIALTGADAVNYTITLPTGLTGDITPAALTVSGMTANSRVYDGSTAATTVGGTLAGVIGSESVAIGAVSAAFADKNVGTLKPVTVSSLALTGSDAGNYTVTPPTGLTANITPAALTITGITGVSREYNNTTAASTTSGTLHGVIGSDVVAAGTITAAFADKNVGTAKPLTFSTIPLVGADAGNYTVTLPTGVTADITQRALATWTGGAGNLWTNASNWQDGVLPDGANVAAVLLPLASGDVVLNSGAVTLNTLSVSGSQNLVIGGGTLNLGTSAGHASTIAGLTMSSGAVNVTGTLSGGSYTQTGGALAGGGSVAFNSFAQGAGTVSGLNAVTVNGNWAHTGGTFAIPGTLAITQNSGNLALRATQALAGMTLNVAEGGGISQTGPLVTNSLATQSHTGVALTHAANQVRAYSGVNTGTGDITLVNTTGTNMLVLGAISNTDGSILIDNTGAGGIKEQSPLSAPGHAVRLTAHSPIQILSSITADSIALDASTDISLAPGSSLTAVHNITMDAGTSIGVNGAITSTSGSVSMTADTGNIVAGSSAAISSPGGVSMTSLTGSVTAPATIFASGTTPTINDPAAAAEAAAKTAAEEAAAKAAAEAAAKAAEEAAAKAAAEEAAAKAAAEAAAKKAAEEAAAKAAAEAAAKKAAEEAAAKAAAEAAAKKAAEEAAAKAAAEAAAKKAAEEAAAKAAEEAAAKAAAEAAAKAAEEAAAKAAAEAAAKAAEEAAAKAAAEAAAKAAEEAAAKAAAEAAAKKAAEEAAAKAAAEAAAKKAAEEAAAKAAAEAAAKKAAEEAAAKAAAEAAAKKAAEEAAAKAAAEAAAKKAVEEAAAKAAAEAAAKKAAEEAAAKAAAEAAAKKAAEEAAAKAAAEAAAKKAAEEAAAKAAAEAAAKKAAEEAAAKAAADAAANAQQNKETEPVREALNTTVNLINTTASQVADTTSTQAAGGAGGGAPAASSSSTSSDSKSDSNSSKEEKKDGVAAQDSTPRKEEPVKKLYCN